MIIKKLLFYQKVLERKLAIKLARKYLYGQDNWSVLSELGVFGFGTKLIRVDFPPKKNSVPRFGFGKRYHLELEKIIKAEYKSHKALLSLVLDRAKEVFTWPKSEDKKNSWLPWTDNPYFPSCDMAVLNGIINLQRPKRFIEVGSGISTRVAYQAKKEAKISMDIISIDPEPRIGINQLCNKNIKKRLEDAPLKQIVKMTGHGTVFSFDGSHRSFPSSDVTVFFLEILPRLKKGTIVHIHDIYLPADYSQKASERLWSEQYLLAAYLLGGGAGVKILLPCFYLSTQKCTRALFLKKLGNTFAAGYSFWMQIV